MLREGHGAQLYDTQAQLKAQQEFASDWDIRRGPLPYIHPPFEALIFLPLTFLPYKAAFVVWNAINLVLLLAGLVVLRHSLAAFRIIPLLDCLLASLAFFPVLANFHQGQDAILLLLVFVLGFRALDWNADFAAGCWLGLGLFKFQFVVPVALLLALWLGKRRGKNFAAGVAVVAVVAVALSIGMVGWPTALLYPAYSWHIVSTVRLGGLPYRLMPNLVGLINGWPALENIGWPLRLIALAASAGLLVFVGSMKRFGHERAFKLCLASAVIAAVTVSYNTNTYDLAVLILPIALLVDHAVRTADPVQTLKRCFLLASPLLISPLWFFLWLHWARTNLMTIFLLWWIYAIWREMQRLSAAEQVT